MTQLFSALTVLTLFLVAVFAQATGLAAISYFGLMAALTAYSLWQSRKQQAPTSGNPAGVSS